MEKIEKTEQEWRAELDPAQYAVLRQQATERPFTGKYVDEKEPTASTAAPAAARAVRADDKFDRGSGWPSFTDPAFAEAVETTTDTSHGMVRTEVMCARCGGHLGHVFDDGPGDRRHALLHQHLRAGPRQGRVGRGRAWRAACGAAGRAGGRRAAGSRLTVAVVVQRPPRVVGDLPRVAVGVQEDPRVAAVERLGAGTSDRAAGACRPRRAAASTSAGEPTLWASVMPPQPPVSATRLSSASLSRAPQRDDHAAGLEEHDVAVVEAGRPAQRGVEVAGAAPGRRPPG